ncbi:MAG TPA: stage V sporulation protein AD [Firmicutes bacterium]|jgi:stage V sporulation protein AD|nr:stage V sporulation protein AD [Bacillota bacterium]
MNKTFLLNNVYVEESASVVGPLEGAGPLGDLFDVVIPDIIYGESSFEKAERKMLLESLSLCLKKTNYKPEDIDLVLAGDLLNQLISANFAARELPIAFAGIFGACSAFALSVALGSLLIEGGHFERVIAGACSHHETAERTFRFPTELGVQRAPTAHWTMSGAGTVVLGKQGPVAVKEVTIGRVVDYGIKDASNLGAAMAPAAFDTLNLHLTNLGKRPEDYDLIATGDLGSIGQICLKHLLGDASLSSGNFTDCGLLVYSTAQDIHAGASGCAASACVFASYLYPLLTKGLLKKVLLIATGALFGQTTAQQKDSIPAVAHAVAFEKVG